MQIKEERHGTVQIVTIDDHLDTVAATAFETRLLGLIDQGERHIVIDCAPLRYVNSAGLKVLLIATKRLEPLGGQLVVCALAPNVRMVFEMVGFNRIMKIAPTREEAIATFGLS